MNPINLTEATGAPNAVSTTGSTKLREIEGVYRPPSLHWVGDGFRVAGYFSRSPTRSRS